MNSVPEYQVSVNLNLAALVGRVNRALEETSRLVAMGLSVANDVKSTSGAVGGPFSFHFSSGLSWSKEDARSAWRQWVVRNGFRDIAELISGVLEEAHAILTFYALLDRQIAGETFLLPDVLEGREKDISKFHRLSLSDKLNWLLDQPSFSISEEKQEEIKSINAARNCLSHRGGVVGQRDVDASGALIVKWVSLEMSVKNGDSEVPIDLPLVTKEGDVLISRLIRREKTFDVGTRITFDEIEFAGIAFTIVAFAQAVASSLETSGNLRGLKFTSAPPPSAS